LIPYALIHPNRFALAHLRLCILAKGDKPMTPPGWLDEIPVIGRMSLAEAEAKLRAVGETDIAEALLEGEAESPYEALTMPAGDKSPWGKLRKQLGPRPWQHTAHAFGYLAPAAPGSDLLPIHHAGNIAPDETLRNDRVKITLNALRVADYPGGGTHQVLFDFYAQNQVPGDVEHLHFNATHRVREGEQAGIISQPIFVGLNVGAEGVAFRCRTVNVKNQDDEAFLAFLDSDAFKNGLKLASTVQPALAPFSEMALALTKTVAARNRNIAVQAFEMGLDFSQIPSGARLAQGAYLAIQIPETQESIWDWSEWVYNPNNGRVVNVDEQSKLIPYNYIIFGVSRYQGE
jgi:hypothetical protein